MAPVGTPRFAASHPELFCLSMSHKRDARLIWVNTQPVLLKMTTCSYSHSGGSNVYPQLEEYFFFQLKIPIFTAVKNGSIMKGVLP